MSSALGSTVMILVTGLPGSGKSAFLDALQPWLSNDADFTTRAARILRLDDFLHEHSTDFSPAVWRAAAEDLHTACRFTLARTGDAADAPALVFVEDNMHLCSMRERYWKLCTRTAGHKDRAPVAMVELRFSCDTDLCLQRNEKRVGTPAYVPRCVILSMAERFDHCLLTSTAQDTCDKCPGTPVASIWMVNKHSTRPWLLVTPTNGLLRADTSSADLAAHFRSLWHSSQLQDGLAAQRSELQRRSALAQAAEARHTDGTDSATYTSTTHRLDLALRSMVRLYFQTSSVDEGSKEKQRQVQLLKKQALLDIKEYIRSVPPDTECDEVVADTVAEFEAHLAAL